MPSMPKRHRDILLNVLENRSPMCRWDGARWVKPKNLRAPKLLQALIAGGYLEVRDGERHPLVLTPAGRFYALEWRGLRKLK